MAGTGCRASPQRPSSRFVYPGNVQATVVLYNFEFESNDKSLKTILGKKIEGRGRQKKKEKKERRKR